MQFKGEQGFGRAVNLCMNVFIGIAIGLAVLVLTTDIFVTPAPELVTSFFQGFVLSVLVGYAVSDMLPGLALSQWLCAKCGAVNGISQRLVSSLVLDLVNVTCILLVCMFINIVKVGGIGAVLAVYINLIIPCWVVGFIAIVLTQGLSAKIAATVSNFNPL